MKAKILTAYSSEALNVELNKWLDNNQDIEVLNMIPYFTVLHEFFHYAPNDIANQWCEYTITILFKTNKK